ncbi:hypothetical protein DCS_06669 [Drechmeria coniospora]|uniref:Uncharacterized protein n=1 Tax=Drechmeria coniospora TaxID=98403 RepID=A0A151GC77_DRECN|nr:hypothetical protein DCS_06669 [Drechmeria coniospora]KYK54709.1 hypothetical protein DCS_06669 [Drechmeria coniospora]ODA76067.1 hypothetical protein RJ55_08350 [Drechmeria coniospora]
MVDCEAGTGADPTSLRPRSLWSDFFKQLKETADLDLRAVRFESLKQGSAPPLAEYRVVFDNRVEARYEGPDWKVFLDELLPAAAVQKPQSIQAESDDATIAAEEYMAACTARA